MVKYENGEETIKRYSNKEEVLTSEDMIKVYEKERLSLVWNKIFEREIIVKNNRSIQIQNFIKVKIYYLT